MEEEEEEGAEVFPALVVRQDRLAAPGVGRAAGSISAGPQLGVMQEPSLEEGRVKL